MFALVAGLLHGLLGDTARLGPGLGPPVGLRVDLEPLEPTLPGSGVSGRVGREVYVLDPRLPGHDPVAGAGLRQVLQRVLAGPPAQGPQQVPQEG